MVTWDYVFQAFSQLFILFVIGFAAGFGLGVLFSPEDK